MVLTAARNLGEGREILLAKFCMNCGFLKLTFKKPPEADLASLSDEEITVLKAEVEVST